MRDYREPKLSPLSQRIGTEEKWIEVEIYEDGDGGWILEAIDEFNNSTLWEDSFDTDRAALDEVHRTINDEGIDSLIGTSPEATH